MSNNFVQNAQLRKILLGGYRLYARAAFWRTGPRIFVNSIPKAGTHLLTGELENFAELQNSRLHMEMPKVNLLRDGPEGAFDFDVPAAQKILGTVRNGQYFSGHLFWTPSFEEFLTSNAIKTIFMLRDPRDVLVSRYHYIMNLRRHYLHDFFVNGLSSDDARWRALVLGHDATPFMRPMNDMLALFAPWVTTSAAITVKFEDLVGERGNGSQAAKLHTLERICDHCGLDKANIAALSHQATKATPTLRSGKANAWRSGMPPEIIDLVHDHCSASITQLGYSVDD